MLLSSEVLIVRRYNSNPKEDLVSDCHILTTRGIGSLSQAIEHLEAAFIWSVVTDTTRDHKIKKPCAEKRLHLPVAVSRPHPIVWHRRRFAHTNPSTRHRGTAKKV